MSPSFQVGLATLLQSSPKFQDLMFLSCSSFTYCHYCKAALQCHLLSWAIQTQQREGVWTYTALKFPPFPIIRNNRWMVRPGDNPAPFLKKDKYVHVCGVGICHMSLPKAFRWICPTSCSYPFPNSMHIRAQK